MREGRVLSRKSPSTPSCMNRSCQRQTAVLLTSASRMISRGARAVDGQQHDPRTPDVLLRAVPIRYRLAQAAAVGGGYVYDDAGAHPTDSHPLKPQGIPPRTQASDLIRKRRQHRMVAEVPTRYSIAIDENL